MLAYLGQRVIFMLITFLILTILVFVIIQLPPGDYLSSHIASLMERGDTVNKEEIEALKKFYGLDESIYTQYLTWLGKFLRGNMGQSFEWQKPVADLLRERLPFTILLTVFTLIFTYAVAVPVGIYAATHQYSPGDYFLSVVGFAGLATPNFMLALILMFLFFKYFDVSVGGLFSSEYAMAAWSFPKVWDLIKHLWIPIIVIGTAGTAGIIRVMRATLLDELGKQYVITARAKGAPEGKLLFKYPVRLAINPIASTIGWQLPNLISGETITAIVLSLPTTGPILFRALINQDMFMAGSIVMVLSILTIIGTLLSDLLLVLIDPRIRMEKGV